MKIKPQMFRPVSATRTSSTNRLLTLTQKILMMSFKVTTPVDHTSLILFKYNLGRGQLWAAR